MIDQTGHLAALNTEIPLIWDVTRCDLVDWRYRYLQLHGDKISTK
jgi:hypothetical protein